MVESKYLIFFTGGAICIPVGILIASMSKKFHDFVFLFLVFGTCMPSGLFGYPTDINFLSREWYRGTTRGIEISYLDFLAIILLVSNLVVRQKEGKGYYWPPSLNILLLYAAWCTVNVVVFSDPKLFGTFELTKLYRAILLFTAVATYVRSPREINLLVWVMAALMIYQAGYCLRERYVFHAFRIRGTLGHPNSLSMYCLQTISIFVAALFSRDASKLLRIACLVAYFGAAICILLTVSRTGFASFLLLSMASFVIFAGLKITPGKIALMALVTVMLAAFLAKSWDTTMSRLGGFDWEKEYLSEDGDRGSYFRQGAPAIADRPLTGVGLNNWSWWITNRYGLEVRPDYNPYYTTEVPPERTDLVAAPAHNLYLITVVELGWPGLILLLSLFARWAWMSGRGLFAKGDTLVRNVRVGLFLSLGGIILQSWTEWEFRQTALYFLGHILMGVMAALYYYCDRGARTA